jgi:hypothetical protein
MNEDGHDSLSALPRWRHRVARVLMLGVPALMLSVSLGIRLAEGRDWSQWLTPQVLQAIVVVNGVVAVAGAVVAGLFSQGPTGERVAKGLAAGVLGAFIYIIGWDAVS